MSTKESANLQIKVSNLGRELATQNFADAEIHIGRDPESDIFLDNPGVSRRHATIQRTEDGLQITDQQSGNGTFVNEKKVISAPLKSGDVVRISKFTLEIEYSEDYVFDSELITHPGDEQQKKAPPTPEVSGGETVFLQPGEQAKVIKQAQQAERVSEQVRSTTHTPERKRRNPVLMFLGGIAIGVVIAWLLAS